MIRRPSLQAVLFVPIVLLEAGFALAAPPLSQEPQEMYAGQKVRVDDGTCPAGQVKEVMGSAVRQSNGTIAIRRIRSCVRR
jgi:hypothetical protein